MSDYYLSSTQRTFFLSGSKIYSSEGSGSVVNKGSGEELTTNWFYENTNMNVLDLLTITTEVSSSFYIRDVMGGV